MQLYLRVVVMANARWLRLMLHFLLDMSLLSLMQLHALCQQQMVTLHLRHLQPARMCL